MMPYVFRAELNAWFCGWQKPFLKLPFILQFTCLPEHLPGIGQLDIRSAAFARVIRTERQFKLLFPLWLYLIQRLDFREFDVVLSSSTYLAKFIRPATTVKHACYLYAPFRLLWKPESYTADSLPTPAATSGLVKGIVPLLRKWDLKRTQAIPRLATSCRNMADEIQRCMAGNPQSFIRRLKYLRNSPQMTVGIITCRFPG